MYLIIIISMILMMMSGLLAMAFYTFSERKILGYMQHRKGPNKPSLIAVTIPLADAMKLFLKEEKNTINMNSSYYLTAPTLMIIISLLLWPIYPHLNSLFFMKFSAMYFLAITSMSIYTMFMAGWSSNSKWSLLGAFRGIAQTISYEVSMSLILILLTMHSSSMNILKISQNQYYWMMFLTIPLSMMWMISMLAETHRSPFDFSEGESELVSGFNIEYSSSPFAMVFMAEYMNILLMSLLTTSILTKNYSNIDLISKTIILSLIFIWSRGSLPRLRYDMLMNTLWKKFMPTSLMLSLFIIPLLKMMK